jgi:phenylacetic acid degradation operon negative regulatory protein
MPTDSFDTHIAALRAHGGQRVWSLMISLFGDLAQEAGQSIDGPKLSMIMGALHIKPEAVRVALHRLRNDGWITSTKSGRISRHALSPKGRAESAAASPRIYASPYAKDDAWQLIVMADDDVPKLDGFATITPRIHVGSATPKPPENALCFQGTDVPDWLLSQCEPVNLRDEYTSLHRTLVALTNALPAATVLSPIETAELRCLIVHNWRRLVLKHPALPSALIAPSWPSHQCHLLVSDLLTRFPRPSLAEIDKRKAA